MEKIECKSPMANKMSSAQLRKIKKPIIEKRRRERINDSLNTLKALVLDAMQKDESRYSKMEKADILEMTVHHLKNVHHRQSLISASEEQDLAQKYNAGFSECAKEVGQFLGSIDGLTPELRLRMMSHLSQKITHQQPQHPARPQPITPTPLVVAPIYREPVSPQAGHVATPCGTNIANLPGSPAQYTTLPQNLSPVMVTSPISPVSNILIVSPGSSQSSVSPVHSPTSAIPLYANGQKYSITPPLSMYSPPHHGGYSSCGESRTSSPDLSEDSQYIQEDCHRMRDTVIAKNVSSSCTSQARMVYHKDAMMGEQMWRPW